MEVEKHLALLQTICRLCGTSNSIKYVPKEKVRTVMQRSLDIDISNDEESVHPPHVCKNCERKLQRWNVKKNKKIRQELNIVLHQFEKHCENCSLCSVGDHADETWFGHVSSEAQARGFIVKTREDGQILVLSLDDEGNTRWCLLLSVSGDWSVKVYGRNVNTNIFDNIPSKICSYTHVKAILDQLQSLHVCPGNPEYFLPQHMLQNRPVYLHHSSSTTTIRHSSCPLLTKETSRCIQCRIYRSDLARLHQRYQVDSSPAPKTNYRFISKERLSKKLTHKKAKEKDLKRKVKKLEKKISQSFQKHAIIMEEEESKCFSSILLEETKTVTEHFKEDTPMRILWNEQMKAVTRDKRGMRWHPAVLRLCIALQAKSPSAYELLRQSGFLTLPHQRTLKHYTAFTTNLPGFNADVIKRVLSDIGVEKLDNHQKNVAISFDEMKISEGLVYSHSSGYVIGFTSLGALNDELERYTRRCKHQEPMIASHVLTVMIRGICASYKAPLAYFATTGASSDQLYNIFIQTVEILEVSGFSVRAIVCDGAATNRGAYDILTYAEEDNFYFISPFSGNKVFLFSDVPHLIKTSRNNLENSGYHNKSRNMMVRSCRLHNIP